MTAERPLDDSVEPEAAQDSEQVDAVAEAKPDMATEPAAAATEPADAALPADAPPPAEPTAAPLLPPQPRFGRARRVGRRLRPVVTVGLFAIGIALGYGAFHATRPLVAPGSVAIEEISTGTLTPPAVQDLVAALSSDDQTAVRAVLDSDPYRLLAGELQSMNFQTIDGVDTLSTYTHDNLAATEIVIRGETSDGGLIAINLVVHQKDNVIVSFR
ncbi:MAG TPA: hypothetical protein VFY18_13040 [Candidatus Limnocylindrales bacterium]|nr:hypothetical protein [Candidatus Limnocylindrales bacterium]